MLPRFFSALSSGAPNNDFNKFKLIKGNKIILTMMYDTFLDKDTFVKGLVNHFNISKDYYVLTRVKYNRELYFMVGKQVTMTFTNEQDMFVKTGLLYDSIITKLNSLLSEYNITIIDCVQIITRSFNNILLSDIKFDNSSIKFGSNTFRENKNLFFPVSNNKVLFYLKV